MPHYQGATVYFATEAHRDSFVGNIDKYAPQYGGYAPSVWPWGYKGAVDPAAFTVVGDRLYLNYNGII